MTKTPIPTDYYGWRKMNGFPKGREVLIYDPKMADLKNKGVMTASWETIFGRWYVEGGGFPTPTRWAYLPKPPNGAPQT